MYFSVVAIEHFTRKLGEMKILRCFIMSVVLSLGCSESSQDLKHELDFWKKLFAPFQAKSPIYWNRNLNEYYPDQDGTENIKVADTNAEFNLLRNKSVVPIKHSRYRVIIRPKNQNQVEYGKKENYTENANVLHNYNKLLEGLNTTDFEKHGDTYVIKKTNYQINTESPNNSNLVIEVDKNGMPVNKDLINLFIKSHLPANLMRIDAANSSDPVEMQKAILLRENYREVVNEFLRYLQHLGIAIDRQVDETRIKVINDAQPGNSWYTGEATNTGKTRYNGRGTNTGKPKYIGETIYSGEAKSTADTMNISEDKYGKGFNSGKDINSTEKSDIGKALYNDETNYAGQTINASKAINITNTNYAKETTNTGEARYAVVAKNTGKTINIAKDRYTDKATNTGDAINTGKVGYAGDAINTSNAIIIAKTGYTYEATNTGEATNSGATINTGEVKDFAKARYSDEKANMGQATNTDRPVYSGLARYSNEVVNSSKAINIDRTRYTDKATNGETKYAGKAIKTDAAKNIGKSGYTDEATNTGETIYNGEAASSKTKYAGKARTTGAAKMIDKSGYIDEATNTVETRYISEATSAETKYAGKVINIGAAKDIGKSRHTDEATSSGKTIYNGEAANSETKYAGKAINNGAAEIIGKSGYNDEAKITGDTIYNGEAPSGETKYAGKAINTGAVKDIGKSRHIDEATNTYETIYNDEAASSETKYAGKAINTSAAKDIGKSKHTDEATNTGETKYTGKAPSSETKYYSGKAINTSVAKNISKSGYTDEATNTGETIYYGEAASSENKYAGKAINTDAAKIISKMGYTDESTNTSETIYNGEAASSENKYAGKAINTDAAKIISKMGYTDESTNTGEERYAGEAINTGKAWFAGSTLHKNEAGYVYEATNTDKETNTGEVIETGEPRYSGEAKNISKTDKVISTSDAINTNRTTNSGKATYSGAAKNTDKPRYLGEADKAVNNNEAIKTDTSEDRNAGEITTNGEVRYSGTRIDRNRYTGEGNTTHNGVKFTKTGSHNRPSSISYKKQNGRVVSKQAKYKTSSQEFGRTSHFRTNDTLKVVHVDNTKEPSKHTYQVTEDPEILYRTASSNIPADTYTIKSKLYDSKDKNIGASQTNVSAKPYNVNEVVISTQDISKTPESQNSGYTIIAKGHPRYTNQNKKYRESTQDRIHESISEPVNGITIKYPFGTYQTIPNIFEKTPSNASSSGDYVSVVTRNLKYVGGNSAEKTINTNEANSMENDGPNDADGHKHTGDVITVHSDIASDWTTYDIMPSNLSNAYYTIGTTATTTAIQSPVTIPSIYLPPGYTTRNARDITTKYKDYSSKEPKQPSDWPTYITTTSSNYIQEPDITKAQVYDEQLTTSSPNTKIYKFDTLIKHISTALFTKPDLVKDIITKIGEVITLFFEITDKHIHANDFKNLESQKREGINLEIIINNYFNSQKTGLENRPYEDDIVNIFNHLRNKNKECYDFDSLILNEDMKFFVTQLQSGIRILKVVMELIENQMGIQSSCIQNVLLKSKLFVQSESNCNILDKLQLNNIIEEVLKASLIRATIGDQFFKRSGGVKT